LFPYLNDLHMQDLIEFIYLLFIRSNVSIVFSRKIVQHSTKKKEK